MQSVNDHIASLVVSHCPAKRRRVALAGLKGGFVAMPKWTPPGDPEYTDDYNDDVYFGVDAQP